MTGAALGHNGGPVLDDGLSPYLRRKAQLAQMESALKATRAEVADIEEQIRHAAVKQVVALYPEWECGHYPCQSRWTNKDDQRLSDNLVTLYFGRAPELRALDRKERRQAAAIQAFRAKHGFNA